MVSSSLFNCSAFRRNSLSLASSCRPQVLTSNTRSTLLVYSFLVDELKECKAATEEAETKRTEMEGEMQKMQRELEEAKSAVTILELSKQDEIESVSRQYTQELASMQSIMKGG